MDSSTEKSIKKDLKYHAHALGIPDGAAEDFINHALISAKAKLKDKSTITSADLSRIITKELKKYHKDLAYVYEIHTTII